MKANSTVPKKLFQSVKRADSIFLANVKEHATLSAGASVDHGVEVKCRKGHENWAADRGCVSRLVRFLDSLRDHLQAVFKHASTSSLVL